MTRAGIEQAYQEAGPLVHTLALRALGSVDEAEDVVRRVFASAAAGECSLDARDLMHDAAERITGDLERRVRAKLETLDHDVSAVEAVTDQAAVVAEADRILLRTSMERLDPDQREVLERAIVHGDPRHELALMMGVPEEVLQERLRDALLALYGGPRLGGDHVPVEALAARAVGARVADGRQAHISECRECRDVWRELHNLVGSVARMPATAPVLPPRDGLWDDLVAVIEAGEGVEPEVDWREEARRTAERAHRRRTMIMAAAVVLASLVAGLTVVVAQLLVEPDLGAKVSSASLLAPRDGGTAAGTATVRELGDGQVLVIDGPYAQPADSYLELWIVTPDGTRVSLGTMATSHHEVAIPGGVDAGPGAIVEITREPYDGDPLSSGDTVASGLLR